MIYTIVVRGAVEGSRPTLSRDVLRHRPADPMLLVQPLARGAPQGHALPLTGVSVSDAHVPEVERLDRDGAGRLRVKLEDYPQWAQTTILDELRPGESLVTSAEFQVATDAIYMTLLTTQNLRLVTFKKSVRPKRPIPLASTRWYPLSQLTNLGVKRTGKSEIPNEVVVSFRCDGAPVTLFGPHRDPDAAKLASALVDAVHRATAMPTSSGIAAEIEKLSELAATGVITDDEFGRAKELFLGKTPDSRSQAVDLLRSLHGLRQSGVLSESEFNIKKWDILSRP